MKTISVKFKKILVVVCILIVLLIILPIVALNKMTEDKIINSLGKYNEYVFYTSGGFQDYTDYAKYCYTSVNIDENSYFTKVKESDLTTIYEHLNDFEGWIETIESNDPSCELARKYDFERDIIDTEDYLYIESEKDEFEDGHIRLSNYDIYLWDSQTCVLYYFHSNT